MLFGVLIIIVWCVEFNMVLCCVSLNLLDEFGVESSDIFLEVDIVSEDESVGFEDLDWLLDEEISVFWIRVYFLELDD